eukprot:ctg_5370.g667
MSATEDEAQEAERQYAGYDFEKSAAWQAFRRAALVVSSVDAVEAEQRLRRVFFRKHVNAALPRNENSGARASAGRSTSADGTSTSPQPPVRGPERLVEWRRQLIDAVRSWQARMSLSGAVVLIVQVLDALTVFLALLAVLDSSGRALPAHGTHLALACAVTACFGMWGGGAVLARLLLDARTAT